MRERERERERDWGLAMQFLLVAGVRPKEYKNKNAKMISKMENVALEGERVRECVREK
jgi:hypothetical protein